MDGDNDLVTEILLRLPVQSVLRFRSVCKSWCNIIDSSIFRKSHLQNQYQNDENEMPLLQFIEGRTWELSTLYPENGKSHKGFQSFQQFSNDNIVGDQLFVVGPVNGLICIYNKPPYILPKRRSSSLCIAVYNPCLDKIKILPASPILSLIGNYENCRAHCIREIGFGFDNVTEDYKVVHLIRFFEGRSYVEVYSGTTNTWRELVTDCTTFDESITINKGIKSSAYRKSGSSANWQTQRWTEHKYNREYAILSFNMQNEVFETILYPDFEDRKMNFDVPEVFAKDDGSFALFVYACDFHGWEVWELEMRDNERRWTHVRNVNVGPSTRPWPSALWKRDGVVLTEYESNERRLIFYDYSTGVIRMCCEMPKVDTEILEYKGSLISP